MRFLVRWAINTIAIMGTAYLLGPHVTVSSFGAAIIAALVLGVLNTFVRPVFQLLALPVTIVTLGLFVLVVNGLILEILNWIMGSAFDISSFLWAIIAALIISIITTIINILVGTDKRKRKPRRREDYY